MKPLALPLAAATVILPSPAPMGEAVGPRSPPDRAPVGFDALLAALPTFAQDEFRRRARANDQLGTAGDLFAVVQSWLVSAGIAEGRGGYPGGRGAPDWSDYVEEQRRSIAVFQALVYAFGEPSAETVATLKSYEEAFPASVQLMGDGWEPHVDDVAGRLIYSLPVQSSVVTTSFAFPIAPADLDVLRAERHRRAVLEVVAHTVLQRSMLRGAPEVTGQDFRDVLDRVLHGSVDELAAYVTRISREHGIAVERYAQAAMERRARVAAQCAS